MKAIMYHYVRPRADGMPSFRYLRLDEFRKQLDYFAQTEGFVQKDAFLDAVATGRPPARGVVLTFDDGFADHYYHVLPELIRRDLWGAFYVPTGIYGSGQLLDVHRVQVLLGTYGGAAVLERLRGIVTDSMLTHAHVAEFRQMTYRHQRNDESTTLAKRILNYFISDECRGHVMDQLMEAFFGDERRLAARFYMSSRQLNELQHAGMVVGSHSVSHPVFSKLSEAAQRTEIERSFSFLEAAIDGLHMRTFCYPYGGFHTFTPATERILSDLGCRFAFNVEAREIDAVDLSLRRQALPRFDCNLFPHGTAWMG